MGEPKDRSPARRREKSGNGFHAATSRFEGEKVPTYGDTVDVSSLAPVEGKGEPRVSFPTENPRDDREKQREGGRGNVHGGLRVGRAAVVVAGLSSLPCVRKVTAVSGEKRGVRD
jgi:hypothetical protein